ncbi:M20/M25/M40 family metallo-hydrolase [Aliivibrio fischeri]|uniref:M20/M25/M40 family metallo-hydrolase n=1 Tax=Aliivibrio fischeri TaxID=668 RepID=A0A6N3YXH7_ALIFS|nr:M20/M25/M40 family metallo-hydrolase [Aliivibrio fischeri]MCE4935737.1 M20/M25/M40 family metallo-hydrolase [Aliivibrio fischeri]MUJ28214.1 M20/M25/M40 family metallo-hydrolase [Aliivibrio fischeri]MUK43028.1 M20/M25/M40 family metallo-hydrolase [Aliivibrio fischeri]MUK43911.1 M20/M25/M40 family metallo-hydrolase [Aliivibrio fischeri]MUK50580.1 M20/M25/M40 family metallo-hydrolase [Aliivibrio fischeri]
MTQVNQERLVNHFLDIIQIDSESKNEKAIAEALAEQLGELGFTVSKLPVPEHVSNGFNIYARLDGSLEGSIVFSSHMDTVTPGNGIEPIIEDGVIRSKGNTILGGDDKSGIAAVMEAVRVIKENNQEHKTLELAFTVYEEGGLHGSKNFDMSYIQSNHAIVLDSGGPIGTIITSAPGQQNLKVTITGRPAHAGLAPEEGINALTVAADAITNMTLSRIDEETTANIGVVRGGQATNIVMPELYIEGEARSLDDEKLAKQVEHMESTFKAAADKHGAEIEIISTRAYNAYKIADENPHVASIKEAFESINIEPFTKPTGGGSDANVFNEKGLTTVNLSTGMSKVHTTEEFIKVSDMVDITRFVAAYLTR